MLSVRNGNEKKIYSVDEVSKKIKNYLEPEFSSLIIEGEIMGLNYSGPGSHHYFSLKGGDNQIRVIVWRFNKEAVHQLKDLQDGVKIQAECKLQYYEKKGTLSFVIEKLRRTGIGDFMLRFEKLKNELKQKGWFDSSKKKPLVRIPHRIGVVTSPTGAALRDFLDAVRKKAFGLEIYIFPVSVQGDYAAPEISHAVKIANLLMKDRLDYLILTRGGGSYEDLWAFNEPEVAEAVYYSELPVVSAVGHEVDFTICDFVSDYRVPTPTAAGQELMPDKDDLLYTVSSLTGAIDNLIQGKIELLKEKTEKYNRDYLNQLLESIHFQYEREYQDVKEQFSRRFDEQIAETKNELNLFIQKLKLLNPYGVLDRGYSITCIDNEQKEILTDLSQVKKDTDIKTILSGGEILSKVIEVRKSEKTISDPALTQTVVIGKS